MCNLYTQTRSVPRDASGLGEAFTMLTTEPGEDVAPYHGREVALVPPADWRSRGSTTKRPPATS